MVKKNMSVSIPKKLYKKIEKSLKIFGFDTVSEYVTYVLEDALEKSGEELFTKEGEKEVKQRLSDLGYM
jgi:Arc/MetJ-type ribon-helix-helix transcriptional regulator